MLAILFIIVDYNYNCYLIGSQCTKVKCSWFLRIILVRIRKATFYSYCYSWQGFQKSIDKYEVKYYEGIRFLL